MRRLKKLAQWLAAHLVVGAISAGCLLYGYVHEKTYQEEIQQAKQQRSSHA